MHNIHTNGKIALSIYDSTQDTHGDVVGLQIEGTAEILSDAKTVAHAYTTYYTRVFPDKKRAEKDPEAYCGKNAEWQFVKITPSTMWYFDTEHFGEERQKVPESTYRA
jgi:hypothetical protein